MRHALASAQTSDLLTLGSLKPPICMQGRAMNKRIGIGGTAAAALLALSACSVGDGGGTSSSSASAPASAAASTSAAAKPEITFLVFETPNLTTQFWDDNIKRIA